MTERERARLLQGLESILVENHPCVHLASRIRLDHQVNHQPELSLLLERRGRSTEPTELGGNLVDLCNLQLIVLNLANLEGVPILDDPVASDRNPVLLTRSLRRRLDDLTPKTRIITKHNPVLFILRKLTSRGGLLVALHTNVLQATDLVCATRKSMGNHLFKPLLGQRFRIPLRDLIASINDSVRIGISTLMVDTIVDRTHVHQAILLNRHRT